jgi:hypothetical protein
MKFSPFKSKKNGMEHIKPTLKARQLLTVCLFLMEFVNASHLAIRIKPTHKPKIAKELAFRTLADGRKKSTIAQQW